MIPSDLTRNEQVYFIPYVTGKRQIRMGRIDYDNRGKFIKYAGIFCDNGEWYLCRVEDIKNIRIIDRLNTILNEVKND